MGQIISGVHRRPYFPAWGIPGSRSRSGFCLTSPLLVRTINFACFRDRLVAIPLEMQIRRSQNIEIRHRHHYRKATVRVHQYPDGQLAIFDGPSCLARFDPIGKPIDVSRAA